MGNPFGSQDVKCPFYRKHKDDTIWCEKLIMRGMGNTVTRFKSKEALRAWMCACCCQMDYAKKCAIAEAKEKYYRGE